MNTQHEFQDEQCRVCGARIDEDDERVFDDRDGDGLEAAYYHATCA